MAVNKKTFPRKTIGLRATSIYVWSPDTDLTPAKRTTAVNAQNVGCNAKKGSQGYDNVTKYVYELLFVDGTQQKLAYVECDYVQ